MTGTVEAKQFACPNCGAELHWDPSQQAMSCPFCGSTVTVPNEQECHIREYEFSEFLQSHPKADGYGVHLDQFQCKQCSASVQVPAGRRDLTCPFCGEHYVLENPVNPPEVIVPESLIPFKVDAKDCRYIFQKWIGRGFFVPSTLKKMAKLDRILGLYVPFFTFDAKTVSIWYAEAGYYVFKGEGRNRKRSIRWEPASGKRSDVFDDVLVPAISDERRNLIEHILPYDLTGLLSYDSRYLAGFGVMNADLSLERVYLLAKSIMNRILRLRCAEEIPGDTYRNLRVNTKFSQEKFKHFLLPTWMGAYKFKNRVYHFLINGQTGKIYGEKPLSWIKIVLFILLIVFILWFVNRFTR